MMETDNNNFKINDIKRRNTNMKCLSVIASAVAIAIILFVYATDIYSGTTQKQVDNTKKPYVPGFGEFMGATQMRHAKLWFAGNDRNWHLANYELDEIKEGLQDVSKFYPVFKGTPISYMLDSMMAKPLTEISIAIEANDIARFKSSFDKLTDACNSCHRLANFDFIVIQRPTALPTGNQVYAPNSEPKVRN